MSVTRVSLQDSAASYAQVKTLAAVQRVVFGKTHGPSMSSCTFFITALNSEALAYFAVLSFPLSYA